MHKDTTMTTGRASLCALGEYLKRHRFFAPLQEQVQIPQKTVRYRPIDKLLDGLLDVHFVNPVPVDCEDNNG